MSDTTTLALVWDLAIPVSLACYSREVVYRTCYAFTDQAYLWLEPGGNDEILVRLARKSDKVDLGALQGEFANALIDYALRRQVGEETRVIREALVRTAFGEALPK